MHISYTAECLLNESLSPEELELRDNFIKYKDLARVMTSDEIAEVVDESGLLAQKMQEASDGHGRYIMANMEEADFFFSACDVAVVPHGRYSPPFLHEHDFIEMVYVFKGTCINVIEDRSVPMEPGDLCIIAPGTRHAIQAFADDIIVLNYLIRSSTFEKAFFSILSSNSILAEFFRHIFYSDKGNSYLQFSTGDDGEIRFFLARIYEEIRAEAHYKNEMMNAMLTMFFLVLMRKHEDHVILPPEGGEQSENPVSIFRYMQENYKTLTLAGMSEHFHYSERHMKRIIKKYTGHSFSENILGIRMSQAKHLLTKTALPVAQVAAQVGYSDVSSFRYAFKKYYGEVPRTFREVAVRGGRPAQESLERV